MLQELFGPIFLGTHTVQTVPKYIWMRHCQPRYEVPGDSRVKVAIKKWLTWGEWDYLLVSIPKLALGMSITDKNKKICLLQYLFLTKMSYLLLRTGKKLCLIGFWYFLLTLGYSLARYVEGLCNRYSTLWIEFERIPFVELCQPLCF